MNLNPIHHPYDLNESNFLIDYLIGSRMNIR